jgi:hypothetical protein
MDRVLKQPIVILPLKIRTPGVSIAKPLSEHLQKYFAFQKISFDTRGLHRLPSSSNPAGCCHGGNYIHTSFFSHQVQDSIYYLS